MTLVRLARAHLLLDALDPNFTNPAFTPGEIPLSSGLVTLAVFGVGFGLVEAGYRLAARRHIAAKRRMPKPRIPNWPLGPRRLAPRARPAPQVGRQMGKATRGRLAALLDAVTAKTASASTRRRCSVPTATQLGFAEHAAVTRRTATSVIVGYATQRNAAHRRSLGTHAAGPGELA